MPTSGSGTSPQSSSGSMWLQRLNYTMDRACKYVVAVCTVVVIVVNTPRDGSSVFVPFVGGMFAVSVVVGKVLKKFLKQSRPTGATKTDPGMPSSHAVALSYLSCAAAHAFLRRQWWSPEIFSLDMAGAVTCVVFGIYWTVLRVTLGHHTWPQVIVGYLVGSGMIHAVVMANFVGIDRSVSYGGRVDMFIHDPQERRYATFGIAAFCTVFLLILIRRWMAEEKEVSQRKRL